MEHGVNVIRFYDLKAKAELTKDRRWVRRVEWGGVTEPSYYILKLRGAIES